MDQLRADNALMAQQLAAVTAQLQQLQAVVAAAPPPAAPVPAPRRRNVGTMPEKFDGKRSQFPAFIGQCELYMALRPEDFLNDQLRVGFILGLLSGAAARWATPYLDPANPLLRDYAGFVRQLRLMYEDPAKAETASRQLRDLRQGKSSIQDYIQEFRLASQNCTWNESALLDCFKEGLADEYLDELIRLEPPGTLDEMGTVCLRIESRLQQRRRRYPRASRPLPTGGARAAPTMGEPMELGASRPRLTPEERERRRRLGLCLYCGESGHFSATCPRKRRGPTLASAAEASLPGNE